MDMQKALRRFGILLLICSGAILPARSQELITNGTFESANLGAWVINSAPGSSAAVVAGSSPFTTFFPAGKSSLLVRDDGSDFTLPTLRQDFAPVPAIFLSFDFKPGALRSGSPWYLAWQGEENTTAFFFSIGGADGLSLELNQSKIATLAENVWYHVEALADTGSQSITGSVTAQSGQRTSFSSGFPFGVQEQISSVTLSDGDAGQNGDLMLDNLTETHPQLDISLNAQLQPVVHWSGTPVFQLQSAAALGAGAAWSAVSAPVSGLFTNTAPEQMRFFRLAH